MYSANPWPIYLAGVLAFSSCDHQTCASDYHDHAQCGRELFVMLRGDSDVRVANADAVMMHKREGNYEREYSQNNEHHSNQG
jgi:hypothetical protein